EPGITVRRRRDPVWATVGRGYREFGDDAGGRDSTDFVCSVLCEPQISVLSGSNVEWVATAGGNGVLGNDHACCGHFRDLVWSLFGEPHITVWSTGDPAGIGGRLGARIP